MNEIFEQVDKARKQVFKKPQESPHEELKDLQATMNWHFEQHEKTKRRWKTAGIIAAGIFVTLTLIGLCSFFIAMFLTKGTV